MTADDSGDPTASDGPADDARSDHAPGPSRAGTSAQEAAEATSREVQPDDPWTEPPNSTVDDWFGQRVAADLEETSEE